MLHYRMHEQVGFCGMQREKHATETCGKETDKHNLM